jgi:hypothetical protein
MRIKPHGVLGRVAIVRISQRPGLYTAVSYFLAFVLVMVPYDNWFYKLFADSLHFVSFVISVFVIAFILIPYYISKRRFRRAGLFIALGIVVLFAGFRVQSWRYLVTDAIIKNRYCGQNASGDYGLILGGIREIRIDGAPERTGAFVNESQCLIAVCSEEFHYCDNATIAIGPWLRARAPRP